MSLSLAAAIASILLLITSQVQRRMSGELPWLNWVVKTLIVIVIALVGAYFYQRVAV